MFSLTVRANHTVPPPPQARVGPYAHGQHKTDKSTELKEGDRVWLNNQAVPIKLKGLDLSRKFHFQWAGAYVVLGRLGNLNYHIKLESGAEKGNVVHRNRLKLDKKQSRGNCIERPEEKQPDYRIRLRTSQGYFTKKSLQVSAVPTNSL
jgi:hypothetical protein